MQRSFCWRSTRRGRRSRAWPACAGYAPLGLIAYGTYLIHQTVNGLAFGVVRGHWPYITRASDLLVILGALAVTIVAAMASWRWFEKPIVDFGRRWRYADRALHE